MFWYDTGLQYMLKLMFWYDRHLQYMQLRIFWYDTGLPYIKKVERTSVQALRLCTGRTAYRRSRSIDLAFHDNGTRRG
jgi:hypothetical protein